MNESIEDDKLKNTESLLEQVSTLSDLVNEAPLPFGVIKYNSVNDNSNNFAIALANKAFYELIGQPSDEALTVKAAFQVFDNFSSGVFSQFIKQPQQKLIQVNLTLHHKTYLLRLKASKQGQIQFFIDDVTEVHLQRRTLSEKRIQLVESEQMALIGSWVHDHDGEQHNWSQQMYQILMAKHTELKPSFYNLLKFVHPDDVHLVEDTFVAAIHNHSGYEIVHRLLLPNGKIKHVHQRCYTNYDLTGKPLQSIGILQDITSFELTREKLHASEELFRAIFNDAPMAIAIVDQNLKPILVNPHFCRLIGYSHDEVMALSLNDFTHPNDIENGQKNYQKLFENQIDHFVFTKRYLTRDGQIIWVMITVSALKNKDGQNYSAIAMVHDITGEKQANAGLIKSEQNYRTLIENASDGIGLFDYNFKPVVYNTALHGMLGYSVEEYLKFDHLKYELFHPDDKPHAKRAIENVLNGKKTIIEKRLRNAKGGYQWFSISYIPVLHDNKPGILIFRRDISQRIEAEAEKEEYRQFLETLMDNLPVSLFAKTTPDFKYLYWNSTMEKNTGISAEQAIGATDFELPFFRRYAEQYHQEDLKLLQNKRRLDCEHQYTNSFGDKMHFRTIKTLHQSSTGNPIILGLSMDITKMKEAEQKVDQSNQMLKEAQKIAQLGFWEYDIERDLFFDNPENREILGTKNLNYFINARQFVELALPSDQKEIEVAFNKARETRQAGSGIIRFKVNDVIKHVIINYKPVVESDGKVTKLRGTTLDITRIRQAEIALRDSETKLKQAEQIAKVGYWTYNYASKSTQFSDEVWRILEQEPQDKHINLNDFFNAVHPQDKGDVFSAFLKAREASQSFNYDFRIITSRKNTKYIKAKGTFIKNAKGEISKSLGTFQDISELKNAEVQLKQYTERLNAIQCITKTGYFELNLSNQQLVFSDTFFALIGIDNPKEFTLKQYYDLVHPDDFNTISKTLAKSRESKSGYNVQYRLMLKKGRILFINEICRFQNDDAAQMGSFIHIIQDITNLKEINFALEKSELQLQTAHLSASIGYWEYNINHDEYTLSKELLDLLDYQPARATLKFKEVIKLIHPDDRNSVKKVMMHSFKNLANYQLTYRILNQATGSTLFVKDSGHIALNPKGEYVCHATLSNITEAREAKQELLEVNELFKTITENSLFGALILQDKRHVFANTRYCNLLGLPKHRIIEKATLEQLFQPECALFINDLLEKWEQFQLREYTNKMSLYPQNAPAFEAEVFVKEIVFQSKPAFIIIACPIKN